MKNINNYILEKLVIDKDTNINAMGNFIDGFDNEDKKEIVILIKKCLNELEKYDVSEDHWCYIIKPRIDTDTELRYMWSSNPDNYHFNIGDKTPLGSTILFIVKKGDEIPKKYLGLEYKYQ